MYVSLVYNYKKYYHYLNSSLLYEGESIIICNTVAFVFLLASLSFSQTITRCGFLLITAAHV